MNDKSDVCYFCGETNPTALEEHHLVPQRYNGPDLPENLVTLCGACHNKIENLYDDTFYERLGIVAHSDDGLEIADVNTGYTLTASESADREIPYNCPHVQVEEWSYKVAVKSVKLAQRGEYEGEYIKWLESHAEEILDEYQDRVDESFKLNEKYDEFGSEEWVNRDKPPVIEFEYEHESLDTVPYIHIINPEDNGMERYEPAPVANRDRDGYDQYKHYRLHCSYCHTAHTEDQHSDMVRHLKLRHGIDREDIFGNPMAMQEVINAR